MGDYTLLLQELDKVVSEILTFANAKNEEKSTPEYQIKRDSSLNRLCYVLEKVLDNGLKPSLFTTTNFWNYVENLDQCLPGNEAKEVLKRVRDTAKTALGRGRVFLRLALNEGSLYDYLSALIWNIPLTESYYHRTSALRDEPGMNKLLDLLNSLKNIGFSFNLNDKPFDALDFWQRIVEAKQKQTNNIDSEATAAALTSTTVKRLGGKMRTPSGVYSNNNSAIMAATAAAISSGSPTITKETLRCLVEQSEIQARELEESRKLVLELKVQLERERKDKELKVRQYSDEIRGLTQRLHDLEAELTIYKSNLENDSMNASSHFMTQFNETLNQSFQQLTLDMGEHFSMSEGNGQIIDLSDVSPEVLKQDKAVSEALEKVALYIKEMKDHDTSLKERILSSPNLAALAKVETV